MLRLLNKNRVTADGPSGAAHAVRMVAASEVYGSGGGCGAPIPSISPAALAGIVGIAALLGWARSRSRRG